MLSLVGGEVRVVAVPGNRLAKASKSILSSGAMVPCIVKPQIRVKMRSGAMYGGSPLVSIVAK
jgi:hypothetical protein